MCGEGHFGRFLFVEMSPLSRMPMILTLFNVSSSVTSHKTGLFCFAFSWWRSMLMNNMHPQSIPGCFWIDRRDGGDDDDDGDGDDALGSFIFHHHSLKITYHVHYR